MSSGPIRSSLNRTAEPRLASVEHRHLLSSGGSDAAAILKIEQNPQRMDVKFPILGFLMESAATGYDLKRRFQSPVGFFYRTSDGSLYPALKKLAHDRLVTMRTESRGLRARKVYAITPRGRSLFRKMLREPAAALFVFDEAQVKIYFAEDDPEIALEHMQRARRDAAERAALLDTVSARMRRSGASTVRRVAIDLGRALTHAKVVELTRLCAHLRRELQVRSRTATHLKHARSGAARDTGAELAGGARGKKPARVSHG